MMFRSIPPIRAAGMDSRGKSCGTGWRLIKSTGADPKCEILTINRDESGGEVCAGPCPETWAWESDNPKAWVRGIATDGDGNIHVVRNVGTPADGNALLLINAPCRRACGGPQWVRVIAGDASRQSPFWKVAVDGLTAMHVPSNSGIHVTCSLAAWQGPATGRAYTLRSPVLGFLIAVYGGAGLKLAPSPPRMPYLHFAYASKLLAHWSKANERRPALIQRAPQGASARRGGSGRNRAEAAAVAGKWECCFCTVGRREGRAAGGRRKSCGAGWHGCLRRCCARRRW